MQLLSRFNAFHNFITAALTTLAMFYAVSDSFRAWTAQLLAAYSGHVPHLLQPVPALAAAFYMWYHNGEKQGAEK